jgi:hypothetical protein
MKPLIHGHQQGTCGSQCHFPCIFWSSGTSSYGTTVIITMVAVKSWNAEATAQSDYFLHGIQNTTRPLAHSEEAVYENPKPTKLFTLKSLRNYHSMLIMLLNPAMNCMANRALLIQKKLRWLVRQVYKIQNPANCPDTRIPTKLVLLSRGRPTKSKTQQTGVVSLARLNPKLSRLEYFIQFTHNHREECINSRILKPWYTGVENQYPQLTCHATHPVYQADRSI